ncbi:MAG: hypothetical protein ACI4NA_01680, partial [Succinivibrio sp.]
MDLEAMDELAGRIREAGTLVIGASNGFSIAEGIRLFDTRETIGSLYGDLNLQERGIFSLLDGMVLVITKSILWATRIGVLL